MAGRGVTSPLRVPGFRAFYLGETINSAGSSMAGLSLAFAVLAITDSASALGLVVASGTVPMVAFMLVGGAVADRLPRALVLRGCNLLQGLVQAVVAALVLTDVAQVWHLAVLAFASGTVQAVAYPTFHAMVPTLLPREERQAAYVLLAQTGSVVSIGGPALAGVLVATVGPGWALAADAATYGVAAAFLGLVRLPPRVRAEVQEGVLAELRAGWGFARQLGWVIPASTCSLVYNALISGALVVLGPVVAADTIGSEGWGLARAAQAVGLFLAGFALTRVRIRWPMRVIMVGFLLSLLPVLVLGTRVTTLLLAATFLVAGAALSALEVAWGLTVQEKVPEEMLSRIQSIDGFFSFVAMPLGQLLVGPLVLLTSVRSVELGCFVVALLVTLYAFSRPVIRDLRLDGLDETGGTGGTGGPAAVTTP